MNKTLSSLEQKYVTMGRIHCGLLLLPSKIAIEFAMEVRRQKKKLLGFDGFFLINGSYQSSLDVSRDFSHLKTDGVSEFLSHVAIQNDDSIYYEMIVG